MKCLVSSTLMLMLGLATANASGRFPDIYGSSKSDKSRDSSAGSSTSSVDSLPSSVSSRGSSQSSSPVVLFPRTGLRAPSNENIDVREDESSEKRSSKGNLFLKNDSSSKLGSQAEPGRSPSEKRRIKQELCIDEIKKAFASKNLERLVFMADNKGCNKVLALGYLAAVRDSIYNIFEINETYLRAKENVSYIDKSGNNGMKSLLSAKKSLDTAWDRYAIYTDNLKKYDEPGQLGKLTQSAKLQPFR